MTTNMDSWQDDSYYLTYFTLLTIYHCVIQIRFRLDTKSNSRFQVWFSGKFYMNSIHEPRPGSCSDIFPDAADSKNTPDFKYI